MLRIAFKVDANKIHDVISLVMAMNEMLEPYEIEIGTVDYGLFRYDDGFISLIFHGPEKLGLAVLYTLFNFKNTRYRESRWLLENFHELDTLRVALSELISETFPLWMIMRLLKKQNVPIFVYEEYMYYYDWNYRPDVLSLTTQSQEIGIEDDDSIDGIDVCLTYYTWYNIDSKLQESEPLCEGHSGTLLIDKITDLAFQFSRSLKNRCYNFEFTSSVYSYIVKKAKRVRITDQHIEILEKRPTADQEIEKILKWDIQKYDELAPSVLHLFALLDYQQSDRIRKIIEKTTNKSLLTTIIAFFDYCFGTNYFPEHYLYIKMTS
jgi:hypothetical protein